MDGRTAWPNSSAALRTLSDSAACAATKTGKLAEPRHFLFLTFPPNRLLLWSRDLRSLRPALRCPGVPPQGCSARAPGCLTSRPRHSPRSLPRPPRPRGPVQTSCLTHRHGACGHSGSTCPVRRPWRLASCCTSRGGFCSLGTASLLYITITLRNTFRDVLETNRDTEQKIIAGCEDQRLLWLRF